MKSIQNYRNYRSLSTDPLGTGCGILGICGAHFGNHCFR